MKTVEQMINELCPEGVEFRKLGEVCAKATTYKWGKDDSRYYIDLSCVDMSTHKIHAPLLITEENAPSRAKQEIKANDILFATTRPSQLRSCIVPSTYDGHICSTGYCVLRIASEDVFYKWVYYNLNTPAFRKYVEQNETKGGSYPAISDSAVKDFEIPLPPLPIQQRIVEILDTFTTLTAELQAELQARQQQYEYYRDRLLTFNGLNNIRSEVADSQPITPPCKLLKMSEIGTFERGNGLQKKDFKESGYGCIHYGQIYTYYNTSADETISFVDEDLANKLVHVYSGDLIITNTSENIEDVCKCVAWLGKNDIVIGGHSCVFRHKQNAKYLSYYFQTRDFFNQKRKVAQGVKVIDVKISDLEDFIIPIPSLEEQQRIVDILDRFEALTISLTSGLPAEIEARQQQYEYYRDRLLTFNRKAS